MNTKHCLNFQINLAVIALIILISTSCKKEYTPVKNNSVTASNISNIATDGIVTVQPSILSPATPQSFIPNGGTATIAYQVTSTKHVLLYSFTFSATPDIYFVSMASAAPNQNGYVYISPFGFMDASSSSVWGGQIYYNNVDSTTSGTISKLVLTSVAYQTDDDNIPWFNTKNGAIGPTFCRVNNIPHIMFQDPQPDTLNNGFKRIAQVKLTGDTAWVLNSLPLHFYALDGLPFTKGKLIAKSNGKKLETTGGVINITDYTTISETVIKFTGGFKHSAGKNEVLNIYAPVPNHAPPGAINTTMSPMSSFVWKDGLGKLIGGGLNGKYYIEQTGQANYYPGCCSFGN